MYFLLFSIKTSKIQCLIFTSKFNNYILYIYSSDCSFAKRPALKVKARALLSMTLKTESSVLQVKNHHCYGSEHYTNVNVCGISSKSW